MPTRSVFTATCSSRRRGSLGAPPFKARLFLGLSARENQRRIDIGVAAQALKLMAIVVTYRRFVRQPAMNRIVVWQKTIHVVGCSGRRRQGLSGRMCIALTASAAV